MNNVIVGTAGHVDHGKTCLIKALTGTDTDRLKEEKKRGITIELGFTEMPNDHGINIGIIDVPGHEKFVKNMLAGIGGIDLVLLVVGADEGVMPQTVEHFEILKMLKIKKGIIVLTKADLVDEEWMEIVKDDVEELVRGSFLEGALVMEVSSYTGQNIPELKELICTMVSDFSQRKEDPGLLRIPVDRVFTIDGFGTVITGTLIEGSCGTGDEVEIYPNGKLAKIRNLQVHGHTVDRAVAGQRTAINLTNIKKEDISRGDVIAAKNSLKRTMMLDVKINMFADSPRTLVDGNRLHLYYGSDEALCKAVLLDKEALESGQEGYAQLRLEKEIAVKKGDRFIIRFYSPVETIGGGMVLDANPGKHKRQNQSVIKALEIKELGDPGELLAQTVLEQSRNMVAIKDIIIKLGMTEAEGLTHTKELAAEGKIKELLPGLFLHRDYVAQIEDKSRGILEEYHKVNPISPGLAKEEYRRKLGDKLFIKDGKVVEAIVKQLSSGGKIKDHGNLISAFDFVVEYSKEQQTVKDALLKKYRDAGYEIPELDEVLASQKDKTMTKHILEDLTQTGELIKISYQYFISSESWNKALDLLTAQVKANGQITLGEFRDSLSTSRKYAVLILEAFDERKITAKIDDARVLR